MVSPNRQLAALLSLALASAACAPELGSDPGVPGSAFDGATALAAGQTLAYDVVAALRADSDMSVADQLAEPGADLQDGRYTTQAGIVSKNSSKFSVASLGGEEPLARGKERLATLRSRKADVSERDGSRTETSALDIAVRGATQRYVVRKTRDASGSVVAGGIAFEWEGRDGLQARATRFLEKGADGSPAARLQVDITRNDGKACTLRWSAAQRPDGGEKGAGTIARADGSTCPFSFERTASGSTLAQVSDRVAGVSVALEINRDRPGAMATIVAQDSGRVIETMIVADLQEPGPAQDASR